MRITGSYRYEIAPERGDFGHILPVEDVLSDLGDHEITGEMRAMRSYPGRLRRLSQQAYDDLASLLGRPEHGAGSEGQSSRSAQSATS